MAQQTINIGTAPNDGTGDTARDAFDKVNDNFSELYGQSGYGVQSETFTTKQDDYALTAGIRELRWNGAGSTGITGLAGGADGREVIITNASTDYLLWLENENTASTAANRLALPKGFPAFLMPGDTITLRYDGDASRWRVIDWPNQGMAMGLSVFDDCETQLYSPYSYRVSGTGASVGGTTIDLGGSNRPMGIAYIGTGTTSTGYAIKGTNSGSVTVAPTQGAALVVCRGKIYTAVSGTETYAVHLGFGNLNSGALSHAVGWEYRLNGSTPEWSMTSIVSGTPNRQASVGPSASAWVWLVVFINANWTRADFLCSAGLGFFTHEGSLSSGLPTAPNFVAPSFSIQKSAGTLDRSFLIDFAGHRIDQVRA